MDVKLILIFDVTPQLWEYSRCRTLEIVIVDGTIYYLVEVYDISV